MLLNFTSSTGSTAFITPSVSVTLSNMPLADGTKGDRTFSLRLTCHALINVIERDGQKSIADPTTWQNITPEELAELVHICMQHESNPPSVKDILYALDTPTIKTVMQALSETWNLSNTGELRPFRLKTVA